MKNKIILAPSVLACDFAHAADEVRRVDEAGAAYLHLDVMDGMFVPNISFGPDFIKAIRPHSRAVFDTHLMILDPIRYLDAFVRAGSDSVTIHLEACDNVSEVLTAIRAAGCRAGLSIKPATPVEALRDYLPLLDMILIMSVEPGFGGQSFLPASYDKLREARAMIEASGFPIDLEVDGGVNASNAAAIREAGADILVAGSAVFRSPDPAEAIRQLAGE